MNSSFAIWYKPREESEKEPNIELHINLWVDEYKKENVIDFGFMINNPQSVGSFYFFIPFNIENKNIQLLTELLVKKPKLANLVFNSDVTFGEKSEKIQEVTIKDENKEFYTPDYKLLNRIDDKDLEYGKLLEFKFTNNLSNSPKYIRFRIQDLSNNSLVVYNERAASYLSGVSNTLVHFGVNINEYRKLPNEVNKYAKDSFINIKRIDMFVMVDIGMEYMFSSIEEVDSRLLETKDWTDYNRQLENKGDRDILAYHYVKKAKEEKEKIIYLKNFTIFNKFNHEKVKYQYIAIFVIFLTGFIGSLLSTIDISVVFFISFIFGAMIMFIICSDFPFIKNKAK